MSIEVEVVDEEVVIERRPIQGQDNIYDTDGDIMFLVNLVMDHEGDEWKVRGADEASTIVWVSWDTDHQQWRWTRDL